MDHPSILLNSSNSVLPTEMSKLNDKVLEANEKKEVTKKGALNKSVDFLPPIVTLENKNKEPKSPKNSHSPGPYQVSTEIAKKDADEKERIFLLGKISAWFESPHLRPKIPQNVHRPNEKTTLSDLRMMHASINSSFLFSQKRQFVDMIYTAASMGSEKIFVDIVKDTTKTGLSTNCLIPGRDIMFGSELDEIAAELPDSYIPSAKLRLAMKMFSVIMEYDVRKKPVISKESEESESSSSNEKQ